MQKITDNVPASFTISKTPHVAEYVVKFRNASGQRLKQADYFTSDKADAKRTAELIIKVAREQAETLAPRFTSVADYRAALDTDSRAEFDGAALALTDNTEADTSADVYAFGAKFVPYADNAEYIGFVMQAVREARERKAAEDNMRREREAIQADVCGAAEKRADLERRFAVAMFARFLTAEAKAEALADGNARRVVLERRLEDDAQTFEAREARREADSLERAAKAANSKARAYLTEAARERSRLASLRSLVALAEADKASAALFSTQAQSIAQAENAAVYARIARTSEGYGASLGAQRKTEAAQVNARLALETARREARKLRKLETRAGILENVARKAQRKATRAARRAAEDAAVTLEDTRVYFDLRAADGLERAVYFGAKRSARAQRKARTACQYVLNIARHTSEAQRIEAEARRVLFILETFGGK